MDGQANDKALQKFADLMVKKLTEVDADWQNLGLQQQDMDYHKILMGVFIMESIPSCFFFFKRNVVSRHLYI